MKEIQLKIRDRVFTVPEDEAEVLKILDKWGIVFGYCDSDLYLISAEIADALKDNKFEY